MKPRAIEFQLEELVFHGIDIRDVDGVADGLEQELARLLAEQGLPAGLTSDSDYGRVRGAAFAAESRGAANVTGSAIARAVYEGLSRWSSPGSRR